MAKSKTLIDAHGRELLRSKTTMALAFSEALARADRTGPAAVTVIEAMRGKRKGTKVTPAWKVTRAKRAKRPA